MPGTKNIKILYSLYVKFKQVVPFLSLSIVVGTFISQVCITLAFLLPLKILLILANKKLPYYLTSFLINYTINELVLILSIFSFSCYIIYLILNELVLPKYSHNAVGLLLAKTRKMQLFDGQYDYAKKIYRLFTALLAATLFSVVVYFAICYIYFKMALFCNYFFIVFICIYYLISKVSSNTKEKLTKQISLFSSIITNLCFLLCFLYMLYEIYNEYQTNILKASVSIILLRQLLSKVNLIIKNYFYISSEENKIKAIFFSGHKLHNNNNEKLDKFNKLSRHNSVTIWSLELLQKHYNTELTSLEVEWFQSPQRNVNCFISHTYVNDERKSFLIKLFYKNILAKNEITLMSNVKKIPAPKFIACDYVEEFECILYNYSNEKIADSDKLTELKPILLSKLMTINLPKKFLHSYELTHHLLWQRLDLDFKNDIIQTSKLFNKIDQELLNELSESLDEIRNKISSLPLCLVNSQINNRTVSTLENNSVHILHWANWSIEPIGAAFPKPQKLKRNISFINALRKQRNDLNNVNTKDILLSSLMYDFEYKWKQGNYLLSLQLIETILYCLKKK